MDITTIIIGVAVLVLCFLPFWLSGKFNERREKKLIEALNQMAQQKSTTICNSEVCCNNAIGVDGSGRWLFYARSKGGLRECVDLAAVQSCIIVDKPDTIGLKFTINGQPDVYCEFYNSKVEATSDDESRLATRWQKIVAERLSAMSH